MSDETDPLSERDRANTKYRADRLTKMLLFVSFIVLVLVIGLATLMQRNNQNTEMLSEDVAALRVSIAHIEAVAADLEEQTPEEQANNEAITRAVQMVPRIRDILCEQFPEATPCQE